MGKSDVFVIGHQHPRAPIHTWIPPTPSRGHWRLHRPRRAAPAISVRSTPRRGVDQFHEFGSVTSPKVGHPGDRKRTNPAARSRNTPSPGARNVPAGDGNRPRKLLTRRLPARFGKNAAEAACTRVHFHVRASNRLAARALICPAFPGPARQYCRPGNSFQAGRFNLASARAALPIGSVFDTLQSVLHLDQCLGRQGFLLPGIPM